MIQYNEEQKRYFFEDRPLTYVSEYINNYKNYFDFETFAKESAAEYKITVEEVKKKWADKALQTKARYKYLIDLLSNKVEMDPYEMVLNQYYEDLFLSKEYTFLSADKLVYNLNLSLTGKFPILAKDSSGDRILIDIKLGYFKTESEHSLLEPYQHLPDCHLTHSFLQLYLFENIVPNIKRSEVVHFNKDSYTIYDNYITKDIFTKNYN